jgi:hypothetical protein
MALIADRCRHHEQLTLGPWLWVLLSLNVIANLLPQLPEMNLLRDCGSAMYGSLLLWLAGIALLRQRRRGQPSAQVQEFWPARAA